MSTKILITILALGIIAGCSKDKYQSKPTLTYKKVNTKFLNNNETLTFTLHVTDAEGDLQDSLWVQESVKNCANGGFTAKYKMPDFTATKNLSGDIQICYSYGINLGCPNISHSSCANRNDTATFKFWLQDLAKNKSDTISSEQVVISK